MKIEKKTVFYYLGETYETFGIAFKSFLRKELDFTCDLSERVYAWFYGGCKGLNRIYVNHVYKTNSDPMKFGSLRELTRYVSGEDHDSTYEGFICLLESVLEHYKADPTQDPPKNMISRITEFVLVHNGRNFETYEEAFVSVMSENTALVEHEIRLLFEKLDKIKAVWDSQYENGQAS